MLRAHSVARLRPSCIMSSVTIPVHLADEETEIEDKSFALSHLGAKVVKQRFKSASDKVHIVCSMMACFVVFLRQ